MKRLLTLVLLLLSVLHAARPGPGNRHGLAATRPRCRSRWCRCPTRAARRAPDTDVAEVIRTDLNRSGQFRSLADREHRRAPDPRQRGQVSDLAPAQAGLPGGRPRARRGRWRLPGRVRTVRRRQAAAPARLGDDRAAPRPCATSPTRSPTRSTKRSSACAARSGPGSPMSPPAAWARARSYALMVADSDGFNPQTMVRSREPLLSPAWSPDGRKLAYVSFERGNSTDLHPGHHHRRARSGRQLQGHQRRAGVLARWPAPGDDPVQGRQSGNLRDGPGQQGR